MQILLKIKPSVLLKIYLIPMGVGVVMQILLIANKDLDWLLDIMGIVIAGLMLSFFLYLPLLSILFKKKLKQPIGMEILLYACFIIVYVLVYLYNPGFENLNLGLSYTVVQLFLFLLNFISNSVIPHLEI